MEENSNGVFDKCSNLTGSIPENLFKDCDNLKEVVALLRDCIVLSGAIPEGLFADYILLEGMNELFMGCTGMTDSVPTNLFFRIKKMQDTS